MNSLLRNQTEMYLCEKYIDEEIGVTKFKEPELIKINWQPINSDSEVLSLGIDFSKYIRIKSVNEDTIKFHNKDRCYIYVKPDLENFDGMCYDADYEVVNPPVNMLNDGEVLLKRLSGADE